MRRKRRTPEQVIALLRDTEADLAAGLTAYLAPLEIAATLI
jgi:hypothetical protein